ncbi:MAG TPA: class II fructose-bisphosphate aldolase [Leptospiraceae bacterium]|nr:class II fructose-bisphosphate aldolase [Leptospiraceae bacterium]HMZ60191.1 class II fructose-bisphosphate aldolase [Leptospiraceae bacterium]HNF26694.1 class II fructose-bisphosphate aldolase [Leptospiraceae bacterium]HNM03660.1 class II fructose-bisphosphate aldolase [Leptospiraceae bacterium]HNN05427.1 class II fructose-bisphosphate aldolase [Leptospiraceae bacterium]
MSKSNPPVLNLSRKFPDGMSNAHSLLLAAKNGIKGNKKGERYAIPAFNVTTYQSINAAFTAFDLLGSSGILAFSNSALKTFGAGDPGFGVELVSDYVEKWAKRFSVKVATHLDHGDYISDSGRKVVQSAALRFTSLMADNSTDHKNEKAMPLQDNILLTREVVDMAHPLGISVEGELGVLAGEEDEDTKSDHSTYTNPDELDQFLKGTGVLMLAPTIGTMHGPNKGKPGQKVKLNVTLAHELLKIAEKINPDVLFVAHGASTLYPEVVDYAVKNLENHPSAQKWKDFVGTDWDQIEGLIGAGFSKINTDTENRQTFVSALIGALKKDSAKIDIRHYDKVTSEALTQSYLKKLIMAGDYGVWHEPKIDIKKFKFDLSLDLAAAAGLPSK